MHHASLNHISNHNCFELGTDFFFFQLIILLHVSPYNLGHLLDTIRSSNQINAAQKREKRKFNFLHLLLFLQITRAALFIRFYFSYIKKSLWHNLFDPNRKELLEKKKKKEKLFFHFPSSKNDLRLILRKYQRTLTLSFRLKPHAKCPATRLIFSSFPSKNQQDDREDRGKR